MQSSLQRKVLTILLFVGFLNLFLFHGFGPAGFALLVAGSFIFLVGVFAPVKTKEETQLTIAAGLLLLVLQATFINRANALVIVILALATLIGLAVYTYLVSRKLPFVRSLFEFILIPFHLGLGYIQSGITFLQRVTSQDITILKKKSGLTSLVVGLVIGLPIVFILVTLLSAGDPIFSSYVTKLFSQFKLENISTRIIFSAVWLTLLSPFVFLSGKKEIRSPLAGLEHMKFTREMSVVMTLVALTLGTFLVVQFPYIFASVPAETSLSKFGVATYSEYVTKGFFELLFVSFFIYGVIWLGLVFLRNKPKSEQTPLLYLQLFVLAEFVIFLISIARRVWLYQAHHGLSLTRVYGSFFLVWLGFIAATLFARHFWHKRWVRLELAVTALFILGFGFFNAEQFIATHNPPHVNKRTDYVYLSRMSSDGIVGWQKAFEYTKNVLSERDFTEKALLTRDDRREIAYAGTVLGYLIFNYNELVHTYGTNEEWLSYSEAVYDDLLRISEEELVASDVNVTTRLTYPPRVSKETAEKTIQMLTSKKAELAKNVEKRSNDQSLAMYFQPYSFESDYQTCPDFGTGVDAYCNRTFYTTNSAFWHSPSPRNTLDKLFTWNGSKQRAYEYMKRHISHADLLRLQNDYFDLFYKVRNQPAEERGFDIDISFDTPFLGGL